MEKIMTYETLRSFTYVNDKICKKPIKGIAIDFFGLGSQDMYGTDTPTGEFYAENGIIFMLPYYNPWAWMNDQAAAYTDEIIDVLIEHYGLREDIPIVSTGGSMGGLSALVYMSKAKRTPVACITNCPVCDAVYHYTERPDLPRTMYSAVYNVEGTLEEALKTISPFHLAAKMPKVPYHIFHCDNDMAVNLEKHSVAFVEEMKKYGHDIDLEVVPGRGHVELTIDAKRKYAQYVIDAINAAQ